MMAQLDDESEPGCNMDAKRFRRFDPSVTVVLALECVKRKRTKESMKGKRKDPPMTKQQDGLVDRYKKKYSKRSSSKHAKVENIASGTKHDGNDMDDDHGGDGVVPVK
uniref:Uncharacterized protein n=1 Tax=Arundo donax TaxID=35708 RepID=A0A0A9GG98_ARUDO